MIKKCLICKKEFQVYKSGIDSDRVPELIRRTSRSVTCSRECSKTYNREWKSRYKNETTK